MKLLIAERDENESTAIRWLVSAYSSRLYRQYRQAGNENIRKGNSKIKKKRGGQNRIPQ
jgi:hypothetical protein